MKRKLLALAGLVLAVGLSWTATASALDARSGETVTVNKTDVINSTLYVSGQTINVAGTVKGDLFCAGQSVEISGTVEGDVICAGQSVRVTGKVLGDVRIAAQTLALTGDVAGSATIFGQVINTEDKAVIGKDLTVYGQDVRLAGKFGRDVVGGGETVILAGAVAGNVDLASEITTVKNSANVTGNLTYASSTNATVEQGSVITGKTERKDPPKGEEQSAQDRFREQLQDSVYWLGAYLLMGTLLLLMAPKVLGRTNAAIQKQPLLTLGIGLGGLVLVPVVAVIAFITVIGLPLGIVLLALYIAAMLVSTVIAAYTLGQVLLAKLGTHTSSTWAPWLSLLAGLIVITLVGLLPYVGGLLTFMALVWGLGSLLLVTFSHRNDSQVKAKKA